MEVSLHLILMALNKQKGKIFFPKDYYVRNLLIQLKVLLSRFKNYKGL